MEENKPKRIVIELDDWNSVPNLFVDGEEIKYKIDIDFSWRTRDENEGGMKFHYKHCELMDNNPSVIKNYDVERGIID